MLASLPGPLAVLDEAQELQGTLSFPVRALGPTPFVASFTAQVVLAADGDASSKALHDGTVHSRGDRAPSRGPRPEGPLALPWGPAEGALCPPSYWTQ